jgi:hypothetical protein
MEKQRKTFISYSRVNKDFAVRLARELKSEGFAVWLDQLDIPAGARWDVELEQALEESEIFMVIMTAAAISSENVRDEIGYAIDNGKRFLPVLLEPCNVPLRLRRFQYVDFTNKNFDEGVDSAKELLRTLIAQPTSPRIELSPEDQERLARAKAEADRQANAETDQLAAQKVEAERVAKQKAEDERNTEAERLAAQQAEDERVARVEAERKAREEAARLDAQKAEEERVAKSEVERKAKEEREAKAEQDRIARQKIEEALAAKEKAEAERKAREEREAIATAERLAAQKAEEERLAKAKADAARLAAQKAAEERAAKAAPVAVATAPPKRSSNVMVFGIVFIVLVAIVGVGLSALLRGKNSAAPLPTATTVVLPTKTAPATSTPAPANTATRVPTFTDIPTVAPTDVPTEIEVVNFELEGTWAKLASCPGNKNPCWTDSPDGLYGTEVSAAITSPRIPVDETWKNPYLIYWQKYNTEGEYDFLQMRINSEAIRNNSGTQDWHQIAVNLKSYKGKDIVIQFFISTDYSVEGDGWYLHDIRVIPNATSEQLKSARIVEP